MRTFYFSDNQYTFPDSWYELNPLQYQALVAVLLDFANGSITADAARAIWFCSIANINPQVVTDAASGQLASENIYRASRELTFFLKIEYSEKIDHLSKESRKLLHKRPPEELPQTPEIRWASKLQYTYVPDTVFAAQLLPEIKLKKEVFTGYRAKLTGGILDVSLNAQQYIDANTLLDEYYKSLNYELLNDLLSILYFPGHYNSEEIQLHAGKFETVSPIIKHAVLLNFQALTQFLALKTKYGLMWSRITNKKAPQISVGFGDTIYSLAKLGYGTVEELSHINLMKFLDLSLKNIIDTVSYLNENEVSLAEIASKTGLSIANIQKLI